MTLSTGYRLLAIVGPTASGKSALALEVAKQFDGEIICADSRTIYRGMDIGTAKPSAEDQAEVPHHLLDLVNPDQSFSAAEFKESANKVIKDIEARGKLPILVGGSGLYANAVLYNYEFPAGADNDKRQELQAKPIEELVAMLRELDPEAVESIDIKNPRRVIRAIETAGQPKQQSQLIEGAILVGLNPDDLEARIKTRTDQMIEAGLKREAEALMCDYSPELESLRSPGYAEVVKGLKGEELTKQISLHTRQLAKRQMTWFKRNQDIHWFADTDEALKYIKSQVQ